MSLKSLVQSSIKIKKAPAHMRTVKQWAKKEGVAERTAYTMLAQLCQSGRFHAAKYPAKMFSGGYRDVPHYGPKK